MVKPSLAGSHYGNYSVYCTMRTLLYMYMYVSNSYTAHVHVHVPDTVCIQAEVDTHTHTHTVAVLSLLDSQHQLYTVSYTVSYSFGRCLEVVWRSLIAASCSIFPSVPTWHSVPYETRSSILTLSTTKEEKASLTMHWLTFLTRYASVIPKLHCHCQLFELVTAHWDLDFTIAQTHWLTCRAVCKYVLRIGAAIKKKYYVLYIGATVLPSRERGRLGSCPGLDGCVEWWRKTENGCKT